MRIPSSIVHLVCGVTTPISIAFLDDSINTMLPWLIAMFFVVITDLAFGVRKSLKLGIHVSASMAIRETFGKLVVYSAWVLMVSCIEVASKHSLSIAMWACLLVCAIEGGSIVSNMLKPYGIELSLQAIIKAFASRAVGIDEHMAEEIVNGSMPKQEVKDSIKEAEKERWERRSTHHYGGKKQTTEKK